MKALKLALKSNVVIVLLLSDPLLALQMLYEGRGGGGWGVGRGSSGKMMNWVQSVNSTLHGNVKMTSNY